MGVFLAPLLAAATCSSCVTSSNIPCVFPFTHKNVTHVGCTLQHAVDGLAWCSTKVDVKVEVECEEPEVPLVPLQVLPQEAGQPVCSSQEACLTRHDCPQIQEKYQKLQTLIMGSSPA